MRRAGFLNALGLGSWLFKRALAGGATFVRDRVIGVDCAGGRVREVRLASGDTIATDTFVVAAGPALPEVAQMLDVELPLFHELHAKITIRDTRGLVGRDVPFLIWSRSGADRVERRRAKRARAARGDAAVLETLPGGVHCRPVDLAHGDELYLIWTYETHVRPYVWPPTFNPHYGDVVLRGCARMLPALAPYAAAGTAARSTVDGGYYCKTPENRPLIGPLARRGSVRAAARCPGAV